MNIYLQNLNFKINVNEDDIHLSVFDLDNKIFDSNFTKKNLSNQFKISSSIKNFEILNILSSNKFHTKEEYCTIKIYQIKYNLTKIIDFIYKEKSEYKNIINLEHIFTLLNKVSYIYSNINPKKYLHSEAYNKLIYSIIYSIKNLFNFLIDNHYKDLNYNFFFIKNFSNYFSFKSLRKDLHKKSLFIHKQTFFYANKHNLQDDFILPYNNIYTINNSQKIISYKYNGNINKYIIYFSFNLSDEEKKIIKLLKDEKYPNLNKIFKTNINFNQNNTKFVILPFIHKYRLFVEKTLFEIEELELPEHFFDLEQDQQKTNDFVLEDSNDTIDNPIAEMEELKRQVFEEHDIVSEDFIDFDKNIEEKLFF